MSPASRPRTPRARDIGLDVRAPKGRCTDTLCPFHGRLTVRGQVLEGTLVSTAMQHTAVVERTLLHFVPKFERFEKRRRRYLAHAPPCLTIPVGHRVRIAETRPISKTVAFCLVEDLGVAAQRVKAEEVPVAAVKPVKGAADEESA